VPRRIADDEEEMPRRRRRGAEAAVAEAEPERGLVLRALLYSPKDTVAGALAFVAIAAIVANALFLQAGPHPSPMFGSIVTMPQPTQPAVSPLPRPRPADADRSEAVAPEPRSVEMKPAEMKAAVEPKAADPKAADPKGADPLTNLVKATSTAPIATSSIPRPPAPIPVSSRGDTGASRRVAAVQRALTEYGYGQLKPTGTIGADTQAAIVKFEHERNIPASGQINARLVRELSAMIGHPID
jgi:hypothetical protein